MKKSVGMLAFLKHPLRAVLGERRVIVISHAGVSDFPLSAKLQWATFTAVVGFIVWVSYSTGTFIAYRSLITEKDELITTATRENRALGQHYALLKRDMKKLNESSAGVDDYKQLLVTQYAGDDDNAAALPSSEATLATEDNAMLARIELLEKELENVRESRKTLVEAIRTRAQGRIAEIDKLIEQVGLDPEKLKKQADRDKVLLALRDSEKSGIAKDTVSRRNQGGPYIPDDLSTFPEEEQHVFKEIEELAQVHDVFSALPVRNPLPGAEITSDFGRRSDPFNGRAAMHYGLDLAGRVGAKISASAPGVVTFSDRQGAYGRLVEIKHGLGLVTRYGHLRTINVKEGQMVKAGDVIGIQGSSGRSSGPHLHYEVRYHERALNPIKFIKAGKNDI